MNAVAHSQYWDSTAIFVTYDEGGGFWDHVAPSYASGYGTRTPMIIISPYARKGVFHEQTTNVSILSFMQQLWGLPPLTALNARQNDLMSAFNFGQAPLARSQRAGRASRHDRLPWPGRHPDRHRHAVPGSSLTIDLDGRDRRPDPGPHGRAAR